MDIPKSIKAAVRLREQQLREEEYQRLALKLAKVRPACWKQFGEWARNHAHDADGKCLLRNWSNEDPKGNWRKAK